MASLEKRGNWYWIIFRYDGRRYAHTLKTTDRKQAEILRGGVEKTLMLLEQKVLRLPDGADISTFVMGGSMVEQPTESPSPNDQGTNDSQQTMLGELHQLYLDTQSIGAMESNSLATASLHLVSCLRTFAQDAEN